MRTRRLDFSQFKEEMDVLERESLRSIKGGLLPSVPTEWEYGQDNLGNWYHREPGTTNWLEGIPIDEVVITPDGGYAPAYDFYFPIYNVGDGGYISSEAGGGGGNGCRNISRNRSIRNESIRYY